MSSPGPSESDTNEEPSEQQAAAIEFLTAPQSLPTLDLFTRDARHIYLTYGLRLHEAALEGDLRTIAGICEIVPDIVRARITEEHGTALHIAALGMHSSVVQLLVDKMEAEDLTLRNRFGDTALCIAAASGIVKNAKLMIEKHRSLLIIRRNTGMIPLQVAVLHGHREMARYLYSVTNCDQLTPQDCIDLLITAINNDLYDIALDIFRKHRDLALARTSDGKTALHVLVKKPAAFTNTGQLQIWKPSIYLSGDKIHNEQLKQRQVNQLVTSIWSEVVIGNVDSEISDLITWPSSLLFDAAASGNIEFITILLRSCPNLLWKEDNEGRNIFHVAILHRQESVFNLIHEIGAMKDMVATSIDANGNSMLHMAAKLAPPERLNIEAGAALQFQRELLWYKAVERIVPLSYAESRNFDGKTPRELFNSEHEELMKEGEKWMKNTASSCVLVATLIAIAVFAAAFTLPKDNNGAPISWGKNSIIAISDGISMFASCTSILMFLSILTSCHAEEDFVKSLPSRLMLGVAALFLSIGTMMIVFSGTFFIVFDHGGSIEVAIVIAVLACLPLSLYDVRQFRVFVHVFYSTYVSGHLFWPRKRVLYFGH